ncbi:MAG: amidohydrolase family protein [Bacteroidales bacterium]|jgi:cytosine/adenosine deaminase-related metal-dependent hydrolase
MKFLQADIIFPVSSEPIANSVLVMDENNVVVDIVSADKIGLRDDVIYYKGALCPGFVNTHCHSELSWAKGLIPSKTGLDSFIKNLENAKREVNDSTKIEKISSELDLAYKSGTVAMIDICNTDISISPKLKSNILFYNLIELYGSESEQADKVFGEGLSLKNKFQSNQLISEITDHAPYSVSSELMQKISNNNKSLQSIHLLENDDENELFIKGTGTIVERRKYFNPNYAGCDVTGKRSLQSVYGNMSREVNTLFVHNTVALEGDIDFALQNFSDLYWAFCPNSNLYIENMLPNIPLFVAKNTKNTIGTDSLASNTELNMLSEIITLMKNFPQLKFNQLLHWATLNGAELIKFDKILGSIEVGKAPGIVNIPDFDIEKRVPTSSKCSLVCAANTDLQFN